MYNFILKVSKTEIVKTASYISDLKMQIIGLPICGNFGC